MGWKEDLNYGLAAFGLKIPNSVPLDDWAPKLASAPLGNAAGLVAASAAAFLAAERGHNPKVRDIYDAMLYCSACLGVGHADAAPRTPVGKLIGTALQTVGPALTARALDGRAGAAAAGRADVVQEEILKTLRGILANLEAQPPGSTSPTGTESASPTAPGPTNRANASDVVP